jgi:hypothetical protein
MRNFDVTVDHFTEVYQWLLATFGDAEVQRHCYFTPPRVWAIGENYVATSAITIDDEDMAIQMKLCWGHIVVS